MIRRVVIGLLVTFAAFCVLVFFAVWLLGGRDPFDSVRVVEVRPSPDGKRAAVLYYYSHVNSSNWTARLAISEPPFPRPGQDFGSREDVAAILVGSYLDDSQVKSAMQARWRSSTDLNVCIPNKELVIVAIDGTSTGKAVTGVGPIKATLSCEGM